MADAIAIAIAIAIVIAIVIAALGMAVDAVGGWLLSRQHCLFSSVSSGVRRTSE